MKLWMNSCIKFNIEWAYEEMMNLRNVNTVMLVSLIQKYCYSLNEEQCLVIFMIMNVLIAHCTQMIDSDESQLMTYISEEDNTDKSQIINVIKTDLFLLKWEKKLILLASIEAAVSQINDNIIHACLNINFNSKKWHKILNMLRNLWKNKTCIIMNKIEMIMLMLLLQINQQCKCLKNYWKNDTLF